MELFEYLLDICYKIFYRLQNLRKKITLEAHTHIGNTINQSNLFTRKILQKLEEKAVCTIYVYILSAIEPTLMFNLFTVLYLCATLHPRRRYKPSPCLHRSIDDLFLIRQLFLVNA